MNNIFKTNSRFEILKEEYDVIDKQKKFENNKNISKDNNFNSNNKFKHDDNSFKKIYNNNKKTYNNYDSISKNKYTNKFSKENNEIIKKEKEEKEKKEEKLKAENLTKLMTLENFPDLVKTVKKEELLQNNYISFVDKVNFVVLKKTDEIELNNEEIEIQNILPGWCMIKKDKLKNKIIKIIKESKTKQIFEIKSALDNLCDLHKKRTEQYIKMWGYYDWEKTFRSPTWDYEYFDRLDQEYEEQEEEIERLKEENFEDIEYLTDYDKHNNYWKH
jgi:hypothetical protein